MFTWICPKCGREVLPSQSECPACEERAQAAALPVAPAPPVAVPVVPAPAAPRQQNVPPSLPTQQPQYAPQPQQQYAPPQQPQYGFSPPQYAPPPIQYGPPPSKGLPSWAVMLLVAGGLLGAGALAYRFLPSSKSTSSETESEAPAKAAPATSAKGASGKVHPYMKHLEVAGIRLSEDARQRLQIKLTVINHSAADMAGLKLLVTLTTKGKGGRTLSEVPVSVASLGPLESKDITATIPTKLRAYELPDWQFLEASFQITEP